MEQLSDAELALVLEGVRRFVRREIWLHEKRLDPNATRLPDGLFAELHAKIGEMGLDHLLAPPSSGWGPQLPDAAQARIAEETSQHRAGAIYAGYGLFDPDPPPQLYAATAEQRAAFLEPLLERRARCFRGFGDPDLDGLPTDTVRARALRRGDRRGGGWMLDGTKIFVADAANADFGIVYAHTEYARGERGGVSAFVVETSRTGFQRWRDWPTISMGRDTCELNLSAVKLPDANLLGEPGAAPAFANDLALRRRVFSAAQLTGVASAAQDMARGQVWARREHGRPIAQGERARLALADSEIALRASRQLYLSAAAEYDKRDSGGAVIESALAALAFASDAALDIVERTLELHGPLAASADLPLERWLRDLRARRLAEGGPAQQRLAIAQRLTTTFKK